MKLLTEEQLDRIDQIIQDEVNLEVDYVYDGEDSIPTVDANESLKNAARAVREYLATLESQ